jgi:hypothetical protein
MLKQWILDLYVGAEHPDNIGKIYFLGEIAEGCT